MPTYAYACTSCGHRFDAVQSFSEPSLTECPECGGTVRKQYGSIGVTFNGSGFYRTDSRNTASTSGAGAGAAPAPAPSSGSGAPAAPAATGS
ncbi:FmdB family zinc ribbon protein [Microbacterium gilvum]|uniref:Putative regulatory protein FmdB zinc ribbon domain-containing protein n=1 Tax=Microbacterium gilvum TaxID=1336204 RepID=A0ABP9AK75_9MICO